MQKHLIIITMRRKAKRAPSNNSTLDTFVARGRESQNSEGQLPKMRQIKVPISSGLNGTYEPEHAVLRYPLNPQIRDYQLQIVAKCVTTNTLVCLPTGLGKTHIAAVLMANFCRWFPQQLIVFLAPTRPLVRQQAQALRGLSDQVPPQSVSEVNGLIPNDKRQMLYKRQRVIFATPQTIYNDLTNNRLNGKKIVLLILDECHRATGNYSYATIIQELSREEVGMRVIGLSASPGSQSQKVQEVISNTNMADLIYKDDSDPQVRKYTHNRQVIEVPIAPTDIIRDTINALEIFAKPSLQLLGHRQIIRPWMFQQGLKCSFFLLREQASKNMHRVPQKDHSMIYMTLKILNFLTSSRKALLEQGYETFKQTFFSPLGVSFYKPPKLPKDSRQQRVFDELQVQAQQTVLPSQNEPQEQPDMDTLFQYFQDRENSKKSMQKFQEVRQSNTYKKLEVNFSSYNQASKIHPKLTKLGQLLSDFFKKGQGKAIVFTNLKLTAKQIKQSLSDVQQVRSSLFLGQSKKVFHEGQESGQSFTLQLKQSQQLRVVEQFKSGQLNTLISTSIGEEGLDIGEVDCIICYDGGHSPIRHIQRKGRTGRKRDGKVYLLLMEGKQLQDYKKGLKKAQKVKNCLKKGQKQFNFYPYNSSLFPDNSRIPIEYYSNQIIPSAKKTKQKKPINNEKDEQGKKPTKRGRGRPKKKEQTAETKQESEVSLDQEDSVCEVKQYQVTTFSQVLNRYQDQSSAGKLNQEVNEIEPVKEEEECQKHEYSFDSQQSGQCHELPFEQSLDKQYEQVSSINHDLVNEVITQQEEGAQSDDFQLLQEYITNKRMIKEEQQQLEAQSNSSLDSQELADIMASLTTKPQLKTLPQ